MARPKPQNRERTFHHHELFFSVTDKQGKILFGNNTFIKISGYDENKIIGAPHSLIRHPDMPKTVFKVFWAYLKENRPIGAYVKNMSSDGSYYWVFAFAFPIDDGYLSIRLKPSSEIFNKVQKIYSKVLQEEGSGNFAEELLVKLIGEEGFKSYEDFMIQAASVELGLREGILGREKISGKKEESPINLLTNFTSSELNKSFEKITFFQNVGKSLQTIIESLNENFKKFEFVSLNMNILAEKTGVQGASLAVVSTEFSKTSIEISCHFISFTNFIGEISKVILECSIRLTSLKLQMIMVEFFVEESLENQSGSHNAFEGMIQNKKHFCELFENSIFLLNEESQKLMEINRLLTLKLEEIQSFIIGLEVIKITGSIESSRDDKMRQEFTVYLKEMASFIETLKLSKNQIQIQNDLLRLSTLEVKSSSQKIESNISSVFTMAMNMSGDKAA